MQYLLKTAQETLSGRGVVAITVKPCGEYLEVVIHRVWESSCVDLSKVNRNTHRSAMRSSVLFRLARIQGARNTHLGQAGVSGQFGRENSLLVPDQTSGTPCNTFVVGTKKSLGFI